MCAVGLVPSCQRTVRWFESSALGHIHGALLTVLMVDLHSHAAAVPQRCGVTVYSAAVTNAVPPPTGPITGRVSYIGSVTCPACLVSYMDHKFPKPRALPVPPPHRCMMSDDSRNGSCSKLYLKSGGRVAGVKNSRLSSSTLTKRTCRKGFERGHKHTKPSART